MEHKNPFLEQQIDIREYFRIFYERRWIIISLTVILCTISLIRSFMMERVYRAETRVLIQKEAPRVFNMKDVPPEVFTGREYYQTQYKILKSRAVAKIVNQELGGYTPWSEWDGRKQKKKKNEKPLTERNRVDALLSRVEIRPIGGTQLVEVEIEDVDPELAAKIANIWADSYILYILDTKFNASQHASGWLAEKLEESKKKVEKSEKDLQDYRKANKSVVDSVDKETSMMKELLGKKSALEIELSESFEYYKENHPEIIGIKSELVSVNKKIESERERELNASDKEIKYNMLKRETETNRELYMALLKRIGVTNVTGELRTTNVKIIDRATIPEAPVRPNKKLNLLMAFFLGIISGGMLSFLFEALDQSIRTPDDIKNYLHLPALATIALPKTESDKAVKPEFITSQRPRSTISESYRSLRTSIMFTAVEHKRKTILLTSSGPQEGKTTTAINLAIVMAQAGEKTILLDADLRQPKIEKNFNIGAEHGMTEALAGTEDIDSVIRKTDINNLDIITCGSIPPNPSELLGSGKMVELLEELELRYDRVIIDTPPVLAVTDSVILSGKVDGTIIVVRAGETNRNAVVKTKEILGTVLTSNLIGVVLNMVEITKSGGYYYYYHYYGKKYGHYGEENQKTEHLA
ncbi:GumC family protein [Candidatus Omnitrophota bacterium]